MLLRTGVGKRDYYNRTPSLGIRGRWDFMAVTRGYIAMTLPGGPDALHTRHLWLARPDHRHGWIGEGGKPAWISAFQFATIPESLQALLPPDRDVFEFDLSRSECRRLMELGEQAQRFWLIPRVGRSLCFEHILDELSLLIIEKLSSDTPPYPKQIGFHRMNRAIEWFTAHMHENPGLPDVARAASTSETQMRRDFMLWLKTSPSTVFVDIRLNHAVDLMNESTHSLEAIAEQCGYQSASALSRAFKNKFGNSPRNWLSLQKRERGPF